MESYCNKSLLTEPADSSSPTQSAYTFHQSAAFFDPIFGPIIIIIDYSINGGEYN